MRLTKIAGLILIIFSSIFLFCGGSSLFIEFTAMNATIDSDYYTLCGLDSSKYKYHNNHPLDLEYLAIKKCALKNEVGHFSELQKYMDERPAAVIRCKEVESIGFSGCLDNENMISIQQRLHMNNNFICEAEINCLYNLFAHPRVNSKNNVECQMVIDKPMHSSAMEKTIYHAMLLAGVEYLDLKYRNEHVIMRLEDYPTFAPEPEIPKVLLPQRFIFTDENQAVMDTQSALMWEVKTADNYRHKYNWLDAKRYCEEITLAGFSDWYLPSVSQFMSISKQVLSSDDIFFPRITTVWTSDVSFYEMGCRPLDFIPSAVIASFLDIIEYSDFTVQSVPQQHKIFVICVRDIGHSGTNG